METAFMTNLWEDVKRQQPVTSFSKALSMKVTGSISPFMMTFVYVFVGFYSDKHKTLHQLELVLCDEAVEQNSSIAVGLFSLHIQLNANLDLFEMMNQGRASGLSIKLDQRIMYCNSLIKVMLSMHVFILFILCIYLQPNQTY